MTEETSQINNQEILAEAKKSARNYIEFARVLNNKSLRTELDTNNKNYLLCLGSYSQAMFTPKDLCKIFGDKPSAVNAGISKLENMGLITIKEDPDNKRKKPIELTDKGRQRYESLCSFLQYSAQNFPLDSNL
jgi:hypothetical protein